jgi:hypothetical protein
MFVLGVDIAAVREARDQRQKGQLFVQVKAQGREMHKGWGGNSRASRKPSKNAKGVGKQW